MTGSGLLLSVRWSSFALAIVLAEPMTTTLLLSVTTRPGKTIAAGTSARCVIGVIELIDGQSRVISVPPLAFALSLGCHDDPFVDVDQIADIFFSRRAQDCLLRSKLVVMPRLLCVQTGTIERCGGRHRRHRPHCIFTTHRRK